MNTFKLLICICVAAICAGSIGTNAIAQGVADRMIVIVPCTKLFKNGEPWQEFQEGDSFYIESVFPNYYTLRYKGELVWINRKACATIADALEFYSKRIEVCPTALGYACRGKAYYFMNEFELSLADLAKAEEMDDSIAEIYVTRSSVLVEQRDYEYVREEIEIALELDDQHPTAHNILGLVAYYYQDYDEALNHFNKCLELDASFSIAYTNRARVYLNQREPEKVVEDYEKAIETTPMLPDVYTNYARHLNFYLKDAEGAMKQLDIAISIDKDNAWAHYCRAHIWNSRSETARCAKDLKVAVENAQHKVEWRYVLAWLLATTNDHTIRDGKMALEHAKICVEQSKWDNAEHVCALAAAYGATLQYEKALEMLDKPSVIYRSLHIEDRIVALRQSFKNRSQFYFVEF